MTFLCLREKSRGVAHKDEEFAEQGEWHLVPGMTTWPPQKGEPGGRRGMEPVAEMEASTQAAQKELLHDSIFSTVNLVPP